MLSKDLLLRDFIGKVRMPLAILLDVSLSMSRVVNPSPDDVEDTQRRHLAIHGINVLLDHLNAHSKLEFVSLVNIIGKMSENTSRMSEGLFM